MSALIFTSSLSFPRLLLALGCVRFAESHLQKWSQSLVSLTASRRWSVVWHTSSVRRVGREVPHRWGSILRLSFICPFGFSSFLVCTTTLFHWRAGVRWMGGRRRSRRWRSTSVGRLLGVVVWAHVSWTRLLGCWEVHPVFIIPIFFVGGGALRPGAILNESLPVSYELLFSLLVWLKVLLHLEVLL